MNDPVEEVKAEEAPTKSKGQLAFEAKQLKKEIARTYVKKEPKTSLDFRLVNRAEAKRVRKAQQRKNAKH